MEIHANFSVMSIFHERLAASCVRVPVPPVGYHLDAYRGRNQVGFSFLMLSLLHWLKLSHFGSIAIFEIVSKNANISGLFLPYCIDLVYNDLNLMAG